jgi:hypothetical protein
MMPLLLFGLLALVGQAINVGACHELERLMPENAVLFVFLGFFAVVFVATWKLTVWLVDHGPLSDARADRAVKLEGRRL